MEPKNKKERTKSVLKFSLLFLVTIALILVATFFDFDRLPLKENSVLRGKVISADKELVYQKEFSKNSE